jgi:hypothetical protein
MGRSNTDAMQEKHWNTRGFKPKKSLAFLEGKTIEPFKAAIRSEATLDVYQRRLETFLESLGLHVDDFVAIARKDHNWIQNVMFKHAIEVKEKIARKELQSGTGSNYIKPVKLLLEMNDIGNAVNWKKIYRVLPTPRKFALDRAPTMEELRRIVDSSDLRTQVMVLMMASGGFRVGAWKWLNWGDVEPIVESKDAVAAKVTVYRGEPEEYFNPPLRSVELGWSGGRAGSASRL